MSITLSSASLPIFNRMLGNLSHFLDKAQASAESRKFDPNVLLQARLAPDMLPLTSQVLIACDTAKLAVARMAGVEAPKYEDNEKTLVELKARIDKTLAYIASVPPSSLNGREDIEITFPVGREKTRTLKGGDYLNHWALPNFFFHVTTAYALLRHNGVALGKADYMAGNQA
jgi:uncharacterized protein